MNNLTKIINIQRVLFSGKALYMQRSQSIETSQSPVLYQTNP